MPIMGTSLNSKGFITFFFCLFFVLDVISKAWIVLHHHLIIFKDFLGIDFELVYVTNTGAAWGFFRDFQAPLTILRIGIVCYLLYLLFFVHKERNVIFSLTAILAGAIGNLFDTFFYGHVIDLFHFTFWGHSYPVFNLADSWIFLGVASLIFAPKKKA